MRYFPAAILLSGSLFAGPATTIAQEVPVPSQIAPVGLVVKLSSIGYRDGLEFAGLDGRAALFFRVPAGAALRGARLVLPYTAWSAQPVRRTLTIMSGATVLGQVAIGQRGVIDLPLPRDAIDVGRLPISLVYSGGATPNRCFDRRMSADRVTFDPRGGVLLDLAPGAPISVATAAILIGERPAVVVPAAITPEIAAAALSVIATRGGGRIVTAPPVERSSYVTIVGTSEPALRAAIDGDRATLAIGGAEPARAVRAAFSGRNMLLAGPVINRLSIREQRPENVTFADLGADQSTRDIASDGGWTFALPASRLPTGKEVAGLAVDVAAAPAARGADSVSIWFNDNLLGSAPLASSGHTRLKVRTSPGSTHSLNGIAVRITRGGGENCGDVPRGWPAQLLGSSEVLLRDRGQMRDFNDFASASHDGVTVVMAGPRDLPLAASVVAGLIGGEVPIRVAFGRVPADGPVILIANAPPSGVSVPLSSRGGRLSLTSDKGEAAIDLPDAAGTTTAQLVTNDGQPILWIKPGAVRPASLWLDQGDVALANGDGVIAALSTTRPRLNMIGEVAEPPRSWRDHKSLLLALAGVVIGMLVVVWALRPSVRKARPGQDA